jgi:uncharacterized protein YicC (UPF0701 family)
MPRLPQRRDNVVRSITHPVKFTWAEYGQLKNEAYKAKVSVAELICSRALLTKVKVPRQLPELDKTFQGKLTEIGKRLNTLTKKANTQMKADLALTLDMGEVHSLLDQLGEIQKQIQDVVSSRSPQSLTISAKRDQAPLVHTRSIRLAPDEYERLKEKAALARTSVTKFLRYSALRQPVASPPPLPVSYWRVHEELSKINNNLCQLQRVVNQAVSLGQALEFPHQAVENACRQIRSVGRALVEATDEEAFLA